MVENERRRVIVPEGYVRVATVRKALGIVNMVEWDKARKKLDALRQDGYVFYSVESVNRLIEERQNLTVARNDSNCPKHHWVIETPNGELFHGECLSCAEVRNFRIY